VTSAYARACRTTGYHPPARPCFRTSN
jgi:hypothetical protein